MKSGGKPTFLTPSYSLLCSDLVEGPSRGGQTSESKSLTGWEGGLAPSGSCACWLLRRIVRLRSAL